MTSTSTNEPGRQTVVGVDGLTTYMKLNESNIFSTTENSVTISGKLNISGELNVTGSLSDTLVSLMFKSLYPVGSVYIAMNAISGSKARYGNTFRVTWQDCIWEYINNDVFLRNATYNQSTDTMSQSLQTGGEAEHALTLEEMPSHNHIVCASGYYFWGGEPDNDRIQHGKGWCTSASSVTTYNAGGRSDGTTKPHNNIPPYITCYMYRRVG